MSSDTIETDDFIIKIPKHIWTRIVESQASTDKNDDFDILDRTGVSITVIERNSTYGKTQLQTFALEKKEYREKTLDLLNNPALYAHISKIFHYIYEMGCDLDSEKRYFAAHSVSVLSNCFPFAYLEESILSKWAEAPPLRANQSAALTLVQMIRNHQQPKEAIELIRNWSSKPHIRFVNTILIAYDEIVNIEPGEILGAIRNILLNEKTLSSYIPPEIGEISSNEGPDLKLSWETILQKVFGLINKVYLIHSLYVIETLYEWFQDRTISNLSIFAAITFLSIINIKDIAKDDTTRAKTIAYFYDLWEDKSAPEHQQLQQLTTDTIHTWAEIVLKLEAEDPDRALCIQFFHDLYRKCASARHNRLDFHLRRWQRQLQQRGKSIPLSQQQLNFLSLIPEATQI